MGHNLNSEKLLGWNPLFVAHACPEATKEPGNSPAPPTPLLVCFRNHHHHPSLAPYGAGGCCGESCVYLAGASQPRQEVILPPGAG